MKELLKKEFTLALHPTGWLFLGLSAMVLIPNYPYYVIFFYTGLALFFTCLAQDFYLHSVANYRTH